MDVEYSPDVRERVDRLRLLEKASTLLADILGPQSSQHVKAEWNRVQDYQGRALSRLTIHDSTGKAFTDFAADELENPLHMQVRLARLWGDLLQIRSDQQHRKVQLLSGQLTMG